MPQPSPGTPRETYDAIADKIGIVPNVRLKDNLVQGVVVAVLTIVGAVVGFFLAPPGRRYQWVCYGAIAGLVGGGILSGLVLMVVGLVHKR